MLKENDYATTKKYIKEINNAETQIVYISNLNILSHTLDRIPLYIYERTLPPLRCAVLFSIATARLALCSINGDLKTQSALLAPSTPKLHPFHMNNKLKISSALRAC